MPTLARPGRARYKVAVRDFDPARDRPLIERAAEALVPEPLPPEVLDALARYLAQVVSWNRKLDLTAARGAEAQVEVLLGDGMWLADRSLSPANARVVDVGTGAGAPIVALLLARPDLQALCVEPLHKRVAFLRTASARLGLLGRMTVIEQRLETDDAGGGGLPGAPFDLACSRATLAPALWLQVGLTLAPRVWVMLASDEPPVPPDGASLLEVRRYELPFSHAPRAVAIYTRA